ncbi:MAG: TrmH family RNA methyltransferase [Bacteroidetes bacterium]|nr:MAG: TrmH family RNA methyltransferase [Bacteroidota bacterium]
MRKLKNSELNRINIDEFKKAEKLPVIVVLDNIRSLNNIGSFFRTGDAFRIKAIYLCGITATPPHREIHKTALGATESIDWKYFDSTVEAILFLQENNYSVIGVEQTDNSISLMDYNFAKLQKAALIFGNEIKGITNETLPYLDECIEIPQYGTKHSLNVSVSAGIVLWQFFTQKRK